MKNAQEKASVLAIKRNLAPNLGHQTYARGLRQNIDANLSKQTQLRGPETQNRQQPFLAKKTKRPALLFCEPPQAVTLTIRAATQLVS